jgi:hypothetical protein
MFTSSTSITEESDDSQKERKEKEYVFDDCCKYRVDMNLKVMSDKIKVRRKLFFWRTRFLIILENGHLFLTKNGHIRQEMILDENAEISIIRHDRF